MKVIQVTTVEQVKELEADSALTMEGFKTDEKHLQELLDWVKKHTPLIREDIYVIEGAQMNAFYGLTGDNAYQPDLHIVCIKLSDMVASMRIVFPRYDIGGRWFDDIVDSNRRRQGETEEEKK